MMCESHGSFVRCALHDANRRHVSLHNETSQSKCIKGHTWGADSDGIWVDDKCKGVFYYNSDKGHHEDYKERHKHHEGKSGDCPSDIRGNECEYYKDGYNAGKQDAKMSMTAYSYFGNSKPPLGFVVALLGEDRSEMLVYSDKGKDWLEFGDYTYRKCN